MEMMHRQPTDRGVWLMHIQREELVERIAWALPADGAVDPLPGLRLNRVSEPMGPVHGVWNPCFCVIAQGRKEAFLGDNRYGYDPAHYLLATVDLPVVSQIVEASPERPYLSLRLNLDPILVGAVLVDAGSPAPRGQTAARAIDVSALDDQLLDAVVRLVRLIEAPDEAGFLRHAVTREIVYRLLLGEQGVRLRHIAAQGGCTHRIAEAVERLRQSVDQPLRMDILAQELGMSVSGLHHHFKAVTTLSPLQFQKQLRLQEARRLMLGEDLDAASAGFRVGYHDAAHFNREYKSLFGVPPMRDVQRLRTVATST
jgi:AraC-like DNA-binding protein